MWTVQFSLYHCLTFQEAVLRATIVERKYTEKQMKMKTLVDEIDAGFHGPTYKDQLKYVLTEITKWAIDEL